jgi:WD40 repeat protein
MGNSHPDGSYPGHTDKITCFGSASLSSFNNKIILTGSKDKSLRIWNSKTKKCVVSLGNTDAVTSVAMVADRFVFSGCLDGTIRVWNIKKDNICTQIISDHTGAITCLSSFIVSSGKAQRLYLVSGSTDKIVKIWETPQDIFHTQVKLRATLIGHEGGITAVAFSFPFVLSGSDDHTIRVWKRESVFSADYVCKAVLTAHTAPISALCNVVTGTNTLHFCSASVDGSIRVWKDKNSGIFSSTPQYEVVKVCQSFSFNILFSPFSHHFNLYLL